MKGSDEGRTPDGDAIEGARPSDEELMALARSAGSALASRGWTLALAESCTGGLIAKLVTDVPGSSTYFVAALVTYSDRAKRALLGVRAETLREHGAVSDATATEMADGAADTLHADVGLSVTGVAGPGGGSEGKPVGTVWFGLRTPDGRRVERARFPGDRDAVRSWAAAHALRILVQALTGSSERPAASGSANPRGPDG